MIYTDYMSAISRDTKDARLRG
ncbi:Protein of unknown function [Pyronema omphalodes CBS 100304]|uniref:Uncharacterized protein n=1 Tax=Pyronema omphalodes (strain CBS 100304) TaxID=1076935 RepID=U4LWI9_PYROM|nr:Protein of unknown function [Pyronema omphalodes CBS 100304]